jgi:hypothetical protein
MQLITKSKHIFVPMTVQLIGSTFISNKIIEPTHYSVCLGWDPSKSWRVEGSIDGKSLILLDEKKTIVT